MLASVISLVISQFLFDIPVGNLPFMYPAFLIGGIIYRNHNYFTVNARWIVPLCGFIWIVCNIFLDADTYRMIDSYRMVNESEDIYSISYIFERSYWNLYKYTMGLCGAIAFIGLFDVIFSSPRSSRIIRVCAEWGRMTLGIYIIQSFLLEIYLAKILRFDNIPSLVFDFVISPLISIGVMIVCVIIIQIIRHNSYLSFFLLGTKWPSKE